MKIVSLYNSKGGVGKTATAVNLATLAAHAGLRVLLCDFDPQGAATFYLRVTPEGRGRPGKLLRNPGAADKRIRGADTPRLDILPAHLEFRHFDRHLNKASQPGRRLIPLLEDLGQDYDLVVIDPPSGIGRLAENLLHASDLLLVPVIPSPLSLRAYAQLRDFAAGEKLDPSRMRAFFSLVEARRRLHRDLVASAATDLSFLHSAIPMASIVEQMGIRRQPLPEFCRRGKAIEAYRALWVEVASLLGFRPTHTSSNTGR